MKLSPNFVEVLGNFSTINNGMVFKPGNILRTVSANKTILAQAEVEETFDKEFGIYDLNRMLAFISLNKKAPEVEVEDESLVFIGLEGKGRIRQRFTATNLIQSPADKTIPLKSVEVEFELDHDMFKWFFNVSSILKCPHTVIEGIPGKNIAVKAMDVRGQIVDSAGILLDTIAERKFNVVFKTDFIKVIPGKYNVKISKSGFGLFTHTERKLQYWIALESKESTFGD